MNLSKSSQFERTCRPSLSPHRPHLQMQALALLQATDDLEEITGLGIAVRTEHPHQALRRPSCQTALTVRNSAHILLLTYFGS